MSAAVDAKAIFFQNYCHLFGVCNVSHLGPHHNAGYASLALNRPLLSHIVISGTDAEFRYLWKRKRSTSAYWFFTIRYGALGTNIPVVVFSFVTLSHKPFYDLVHQLFMLATQLVVSVAMILRIWALYGRSARVLWWLIGIASCFIAISIWSMNQGQHGFPLTVLSGCHLAIVQSASFHLAGPWECLFAFDSIIFGLNCYNAYLTRRGDGRAANMPIHQLLVRDGVMYFAAMALANLANIIGGPLVPGSLATFATCMSVVMMSRLMLNLHERTDIGVLTELRMSDIDDELVFAVGGDDVGTLPLTAAGPLRER
ncbi:hypothetical protein B0H17DRAFT_1200525 [Mycena rosella]|uniref:Transmembrane protein n=1 Tax=Mycena rosella TaxID=1033263 RepID=A0AAD7DJ74_MYCRO|nr:hypothetical protein B0H17DRAFT_1200525 [Mycena rosella]